MPTPVTVPPVTAQPILRSFGGDVLVESYVDKNISTPCGGIGRFADFQVGQLVTVADGAGTLVAQGTLTGCTWANLEEQFNVPGQPNYERAEPLLSINVPNVPELPSYLIRIGWKQWQPISLSQMQAWNWALVLNVK